MSESFARRVSGIGSLAEPARRALYLHVAAQPGPVSRDQAAEHLAIPRHRAKFHLDRLVDEGLLEAGFAQLSDRRGPGSGRPSKVYRRSDQELEVSLPERHYDLAGRILARAVEDAARDGRPVMDAVRQAAVEIGREVAAGQGSAPELMHVLASVGYEPAVEGSTVLMRNCPFHALAREHTGLVCGMNLDLLRAMLEQLGQTDVVAELDPAADRCCVTLRRGAPSA